MFTQIQIIGRPLFLVSEDEFIMINGLILPLADPENPMMYNGKEKEKYCDEKGVVKEYTDDLEVHVYINDFFEAIKNNKPSAMKYFNDLIIAFSNESINKKTFTFTKGTYKFV